MAPSQWQRGEHAADLSSFIAEAHSLNEHLANGQMRQSHHPAEISYPSTTIMQILFANHDQLDSRLPVTAMHCVNLIFEEMHFGTQKGDVPMGDVVCSLDSPPRAIGRPGMMALCMMACLHELGARVDCGQHHAAQDKACNDALPLNSSPGGKDEDGELAICGRKIDISERSPKGCTAPRQSQSQVE